MLQVPAENCHNHELQPEASEAPAADCRERTVPPPQAPATGERHSVVSVQARDEMRKADLPPSGLTFLLEAGAVRGRQANALSASRAA